MCVFRTRGSSWQFEAEVRRVHSRPQDWTTQGDLLLLTLFFQSFVRTPLKLYCPLQITGTLIEMKDSLGSQLDVIDKNMDEEQIRSTIEEVNSTDLCSSINLLH